MIELFLGIAVASSGLLLALVQAKATPAQEDIWLKGWLAVYCLMSLGFLGSMHLDRIFAATSSVLATSLIVLAAPFAYFYAKEAAGESVPLRGLHFLPFVSNLIMTGVLFLTGNAMLDGPAVVINLDSVFTFLILLPPLVLVASLSYPILAIRAVERRRAFLKGRLSTLESAGLAWVKVWSVSTALLFLALLFSGVAINSGLISLGPYILACLAAFCAQLLFVGFRGLKQTEAFGAMPVQGETPEATVPIADGDTEHLASFMVSQKPWAEMGLTIDDLAGRLGWDTERLSQTIRFGFGESYFDFINRHRVDEVKRLMGSLELKRVTLVSLAFDAGFGSKSAFNEAFKRHAGMTPSQYRRSFTSD
jgi:AraC-like DNA-binding protein